jgi:hypothetical protein
MLIDCFKLHNGYCNLVKVTAYPELKDDET